MNLWFFIHSIFFAICRLHHTHMRKDNRLSPLFCTAFSIGNYKLLCSSPSFSLILISHTRLDRGQVDFVETTETETRKRKHSVKTLNCILFCSFLVRLLHAGQRGDWILFLHYALNCTVDFLCISTCVFCSVVRRVLAARTSCGWSFTGEQHMIYRTLVRLLQLTRIRVYGNNLLGHPYQNGNTYEF